MKKLVSIAGIFLIPFFLHAEVNYFSGTWDETVAKAKTEKKIVMLDCYTDWCSWCKVMDRTDFKNDSITGELDKDFIASHREMEKDPEGLKLSMKYHVQAFPTFLFFSPGGKLIHVIVGYRKTADFYSELKKLEDGSSLENFPGYGPLIDPGYPEFYKKSFGTKETRVIPKADTINSFLAKQKDLTNEVSWSVINRFSSMDEKYSNSVLTNADKLRSLYGKDQVDSKIYTIIQTKAFAAANNNDEKALTDAMNELDKYLPVTTMVGSNSDAKLIWRQNFYEKNNQWSKVADLVQSYIDTSKIENIAGYVNGVSWDFYQKCDDIKVCERTLPWMKKVTDASVDYPSMDTYAALLYKTGHYKEAKDEAEKAIAEGKNEKEDTSSTEKLLVDINAKLK